jgi:hypothetical protein
LSVASVLSVLSAGRLRVLLSGTYGFRAGGFW